jgi:hypothetical protein
MADLGRILQAAGDEAAAEQWLRRALEGQRAVLPAGHPATAETLAWLGSVLVAASQPGVAEPMLREAVGLLSERVLPAHVSRVSRAEGAAALGSCLMAQERHAEAEPLLVAAYEGLRASRGAGHPSTALAEQRLARCRALRKR